MAHVIDDKNLSLNYTENNDMFMEIKKNRKILMDLRKILTSNLQSNIFRKYYNHNKETKDTKDDEESSGFKKMIESNVTKTDSVTLGKNIIAWTALAKGRTEIASGFNILKVIKNRNIKQLKDTYRYLKLSLKNGKVEKGIMELTREKNVLKFLSKTSTDSSEVAKVTKQIDKLDEQIKILKDIKSYDSKWISYFKDNRFKLGTKTKTFLKDMGKNFVDKVDDFKKIITLKGVGNFKSFAGAMLGPAAMAVNMHTILDQGESSFKRTLAMIDLIGDFTLLSPITSMLNFVGPLVYDMLDPSTQEAVDTVFTEIKNALDYAYRAVYVVIKPLFDSVKSLFGIVFDIVGVCVKKIFKLMSGPLSWIFKWVGAGIKLLVDIWSVTVGSMIQKITAVIDMISYLMKHIYEFISNPMKYIGSIGESMKGIMEKGVEGVKNFVTNPMDYLNPKKQKDETKNGLKKVFDDIPFSHTGKGAQGVTSFATNTMDYLNPKKHSTKSEFKKVLKNVPAPAAETLDMAYDLMGNETKSKVDDLTNTVGRSIDHTIIKVLNKTKRIMKEIEQRLKIQPLPKPQKMEKGVPLYSLNGKSTYNNKSNYNYNNYNVSVDVLESRGIQIMDMIMPEVNKAIANA